MPDYNKDLSQFLADWDLQARNAEMSESTRRVAEADAVKKVVTILVDGLG